MEDFTEAERADIRAVFDKFDADRNGHVTVAELATVLKELGEATPAYKIRDMIKEVDLDENGTVEFDEFLTMYSRVKSGKTTYKLAETSEKAKTIIKTGGLSAASAEGTQHAFSEEEKEAFTDWINFQLEADPDLKQQLPISESGDALFRAVHDGIVLCKLINSSIPGTIDERAINRKLNTYTIHENQTLALNSASAIGCNIINIGAEDLVEGKPHLVLGLLWQVIRIGLFAKINLQNCPGLARLLEPGEELSDLLALPPDQILLRWFNYHLAQAGHPRRVHNFSKDISDSECYTVLLNQIAPPHSGVDMSPLSEDDTTKRAELMLQQADKLGCRKFVRPRDVVRGHGRLNLAYVANLFNTHPGLEPMEVEIIEETREEKTFRNWMNSLGVNPFVNNLYNDLRDGLVLLQLFDKVFPGIVDWSRVTQDRAKLNKMGGNMRKIQNCNYALELAHKVKFSVVGIGGEDISAGHKMFTLAIVWQLMRAYTVSVLQKLAGSDQPIKDQDIVDWANGTLRDAGKSSSISSFKDPCIATSVPVLDLVDAIKPNSVKYDLVLPAPASEADRMANAKYAISMSRKIGARVYALPEDLVEVKPKMVMTVFACLMVRSKE